MQFEIKTTPKVKQFRFAFDIPIIKRTIRFTTMWYRSPDVWSTGISNRCTDSRYVPFFDFDNHDLKEIRDEIKYLQNFFKLSHAYVFEMDRDKSYHVIILDKFSFLKMYKILQESSTEWAYLNSARMTRGKEWVLRITDKANRKPPKFVEVIKSPHQVREISTAHKNFLQKYEHYLVPKLKYKHEDGITILPAIRYNTGNRI